LFGGGGCGVVSRQKAIESAWRLFASKIAASEVEAVEANFIDGSWAVVFHKRSHPEYVDAPGCWVIDVPVSGQPTWFEVL
jgi:hypothetical protein